MNNGDAIFRELAGEFHDTLEIIGKGAVPLSNYLKIKLELMDTVLKLYSRNKTLARLAYLDNYVFLTELGPPSEFQPRRGRKQSEVEPLKLIMKVLRCSHRSAVDYQLAQKSREFFNRFLNSARGRADS